MGANITIDTAKVIIDKFFDEKISVIFFFATISIMHGLT